jgi:hypothetical protein
LKKELSPYLVTPVDLLHGGFIEENVNNPREKLASSHGELH